MAPIKGKTKMIGTIRIYAAVFFVLSCPSAFACSFPDPVPIPNGATATEIEMIATDSAIKRYMLRMQNYADCVEQETHALRSNASRKDKAGSKSREENSIQEQNRAAAAIENVAEQFNQAIAEYNKRSR